VTGLESSRVCPCQAHAGLLPKSLPVAHSVRSPNGVNKPLLQQARPSPSLLQTSKGKGPKRPPEKRPRVTLKRDTNHTDHRKPTNPLEGDVRGSSPNSSSSNRGPKLMPCQLRPLDQAPESTEPSDE